MTSAVDLLAFGVLAFAADMAFGGRVAVAGAMLAAFAAGIAAGGGA